MSLRPNKDAAFNIARQLTPQYTELLIDLKRSGGRVMFSSEVAAIQNRVCSYVLIYDSEFKISRALLLAMLGEDEYQKFEADNKVASPEEQQQLVDEFADPESMAEIFDTIKFPQSPEEWRLARETLSQMPAEEQKEAEKRSAFFWIFFFSSFFNILSLMVHGAKMTSLVPRAMGGDDEAFLKAIQIDRMLLLHHPYFRDRKFRAQNEGDVDFLSKLAYRESGSPLRGKIQYPGLYMLFGVLDALQWLDELKHDEILNICDDSELDRYQHRIEDVNYLTKRLIEYRRWQKTGGVSMH